jgi:hypothetical protein
VETGTTNSIESKPDKVIHSVAVVVVFVVVDDTFLSQ